MSDRIPSFEERLRRSVDERGNTKLYFLKSQEGQTVWPKDGVEIRDIRSDHNGYTSYTLLPEPGSREVHPVPQQSYNIANELHQNVICSEVELLGYQLVSMEYPSLEKMPRKEIKLHYDVMLNFIEWDIKSSKETLAAGRPAHWDLEVLEEAYRILSTCFDKRKIQTVPLSEIQEKFSTALKYFDDKCEETRKSYPPPQGRTFHSIPNTWNLISRYRFGNRFPFLRTW